jgi:hypothetical protein
MLVYYVAWVLFFDGDEDNKNITIIQISASGILMVMTAIPVGGSTFSTRVHARLLKTG